MIEAMDPSEIAVKTTFSIYSGRRAVAVRQAWSANEALVEYVRGQGCRSDEIVRLRSDALAWRGAVYTAAPVSGDAIAHGSPGPARMGSTPPGPLGR